MNAMHQMILWITKSMGMAHSFHPAPLAGEPEVLNKLDENGVLGHRTSSFDDPSNNYEKEVEPTQGRSN
jgi:hypothetical protein